MQPLTLYSISQSTILHLTNNQPNLMTNSHFFSTPFYKLFFLSPARINIIHKKSIQQSNSPLNSYHLIQTYVYECQTNVKPSLFTIRKTYYIVSQPTTLGSHNTIVQSSTITLKSILGNPRKHSNMKNLQRVVALPAREIKLVAERELRPSIKITLYACTYMVKQYYYMTKQIQLCQLIQTLQVLISPLLYPPTITCVHIISTPRQRQQTYKSLKGNYQAGKEIQKRQNNRANVQSQHATNNRILYIVFRSERELKSLQNNFQG
eukprot:TRINITY_DN2078_c0_g1_i10.p1 TRINITY_DN2078_c0_g1~~TRINITY_DN2078_c0_g1_i10.p1  ORF type:complete len:288 (+),score=-26.06 TRINITY_DN2078_c0_g1_i10:74-865(+)